MRLSKVSEIIGSSPTSFEATAESVLACTNQNFFGITGIKFLDERARVKEGGIVEHPVALQGIFLFDDSEGD